MNLNFLRSIVLLLVLPISASSANPPAKHKTVYDYSLVSLDGKTISLSTYKDKVLLIVNLASKSVYVNQLGALQDLQKAYADKGLVILGIPCGDFGAEELSDTPSIQHFYQDTEHLSFPIFSKASLRGKDAIPLVHFLTDPKDGLPGGDIHWNFTKFIVDRQGQPVLRFEADSDPADPEFRVQIEQVLNGTFKKGAKTPPGADSPADDDDEE
jgi:glutathione peroxidase